MNYIKQALEALNLNKSQILYASKLDTDYSYLFNRVSFDQIIEMFASFWNELRYHNITTEFENHENLEVKILLSSLIGSGYENVGYAVSCAEGDEDDTKDWDIFHSDPIGFVMKLNPIFVQVTTNGKPLATIYNNAIVIK